MKRFRFVAVAALEAFLLGAGIALSSVTTDDLGPAPDSKQIAYVALSPDCHDIAMVAKTDMGVELRVNGKPQATADEIPIVLYSPDSAWLAYTARKDKTWYVILDGQETPTGSLQASQLVFSDDSRHFAYVTAAPQSDSAVVDGKILASCPFLTQLTLSPDGSHVAYAHFNDQRVWAVVRDGKEIGKGYAHGVARLRFSRDGERFVFVGCLSANPQAASRYEVDVDGSAYGPYYDVSIGPVFTPDSKHWTFGGGIADTDPVQPSRIPNGGIMGRDFRIMDGKYETDGAWLEQILYSADGEHVLTLALNYAQSNFLVQRHLLIDGQERNVGQTDVTISPDGSCLAGLAYRVVQIDGRDSRTYREHGGPPLFGPDSRHVAFAVANDAETRWTMEVDDRTQPDEIVVPSADLTAGQWEPFTRVKDQASFDNGHSYNGQYPFHFDPDGTLAYFRVTDGHLYRVHWKPDDATTAPATRP